MGGLAASIRLDTHPGHYKVWLQWPNGTWTGELDPSLFQRSREDEGEAFGWTTYYQWFPLSTLGRSGPRQSASREREPQVCPRCHYELSVTGECEC